jgi:RNA polymerase sigma-70 factor (ECF subfamily)
LFSVLLRKLQKFFYGIVFLHVYNEGKTKTGQKSQKMKQDPLYEAIRRYAARLLTSTEAGEDIAQEVFLRLEQQREHVNNPQVWAYRTARNLVIDRYRQSGKTSELPQDLPADATRFNPALIAEQKETLEMMQQKINDLSPRHREVLRLKFQEKLKYAEIAEILGEPVTTVAWLIHEAVSLLRKELRTANGE